jgi:hypothetical protein
LLERQQQTENASQLGIGARISHSMLLGERVVQ